MRDTTGYVGYMLVFEHRERGRVFLVIIKLWLLMLTLAPRIDGARFYNQKIHLLPASYTHDLGVFNALLNTFRGKSVHIDSLLFFIALTETATASISPRIEITFLAYT
jgi:hypothetical protein